MEIDNLYSPHVPTIHIDLDNICHNYRIMAESSIHAKASQSDAFYEVHDLPKQFAKLPQDTSFVWPSQLAVIKSDAYGHGHIKVANALIQDGVIAFATGSIQEACMLRQGIEGNGATPLIISLLGIIYKEDIELCLKHGIIPLVHTFNQIQMLEAAKSILPIVIKCNTGMSRLGFNEEEIPSLVESLQKLNNILPVLALSHMHSADTDNGIEEAKKQATIFARMLKNLRATWPSLAASLANSAGTLLSKEIKEIIGPHICRPGIALYGVNPYFNTKLEHLENRFLPTMWMSAPIIATRTLSKNSGISYGHIYKAEKNMPVAVLSTGYADGFSRSLTHKAHVCINGTRVPLIGRVAMQMIFADLSNLDKNSTEPPTTAWLLGGPYEQCIPLQELTKQWGSIPHEAMCMLGYNTRVYTKFYKL